MDKRVLWVDNDPGYVKPFVIALKRGGIDVTLVTSAGAAEREIAGNRFDLVILDVMIPTREDAEEEVYDPAETRQGLRTGLVFYRRMQGRLRELRTPVLVFSLRVDEEIENDFKEAGLPSGHFVRKLELKEAPSFVAKVEEVLGQSFMASGGS